MLKILFSLSILALVASCVPKPEKISGCKDGTSFSDDSLTCVTSTPAITYGAVFNSLAALEDAATPFSLPSATTDDVPGSLYYFISSAPSNGIVSDCADRDAGGEATGTGTLDADCNYTGDANYSGSDSFGYKVCNSSNGSLRCGTEITVTVTIAAVNDAPVLTVPSTVNVYEGNVISMDIRAASRGLDETDDIYVCLNPDASLAAALTGEQGVDLAPTPVTPFPTGVCTLVANEADNLTSAIARFTGTANLLACPDDSCTGGGVLTVSLCEDAGCTTTIETANVTVTVLAKNFTPTFADASPFTLTPATVSEGAAVYTIGTNVASVQDLPLATDADGEAITYEYVLGSLTPSGAGVLACTNGTDLACTFTPDANYAGVVSFKYVAKDSKALPTSTSAQMQVQWTMTAVNDAPEFLITNSEVYTLSLAPSALTEGVVLSRTLKVSEGGGADENSQVLTMSATTSDAGVMPLTGIRVYRGATLLGDLSSAVTLASAAIDADLASYTMTFTPPTGIVTDDDAIITLTLNDSITTTDLVITFNAITNIDNTPDFTVAPSSSFGLQLATNKDLIFSATPGSGDWVTVAGASQDLIITVESSSNTVVDASLLTLTTPVGVASVTKRVGADCTASRCLFDLDYTGTDDPADDDITLNVTAGLRGSSTLKITLSDGVSTAVHNVSTTVYNFAVTFNGWSKLNVQGVTAYNSSQTPLASDPANLTVGWNPLTVTEGGTPTSAYTVRVYRKAASAYATLSGNALDNTGVSASANEVTFSNANAPFADTTSFAAGERFYLALAVVPLALNEPFSPPAATDSSIEIVIPPDNMVLVHRWMANKEFCDSTGQTASRSNNYRCLNQGLGAIDDTGTKYYDQFVHVFADKFEAGCPFDVAEDSAPSIDATLNVGMIHYDRDAQNCTIAAGGVWTDLPSQAAMPTLKLNEGQLPPYVNIVSTDAQTMCENQNIYCDGVVCAGDFAALDRELPTRREALAAAVWPTTSPSADTIVTLEDSGDHTKFACNTNSANGLTFNAIGSVTNNVEDTFPATPTSSIKTLTNSADATRYCVSRYGVKNIIGNVQEHLADTFNCVAGVAPDVACTMTAPQGTIATTSRDDSLAANNSLGIVYAFDGVDGYAPLLQSGSTSLSAYSAFMATTVDRFHLAIGLPFKEDTGLAHPQAGLPRYSASASGASVINNTQLSSDGIGLDYTVDGADYSAAQGGTWSDLATAGRFAFRVRKDAAGDQKTGFRCVVRMTAQP